MRDLSQVAARVRGRKRKRGRCNVPRTGDEIRVTRLHETNCWIASRLSALLRRFGGAFLFRIYTIESGFIKIDAVPYSSCVVLYLSIKVSQVRLSVSHVTCSSLRAAGNREGEKAKNPA